MPEESCRWGRRPLFSPPSAEPRGPPWQTFQTRPCTWQPADSSPRGWEPIASCSWRCCGQTCECRCIAPCFFLLLSMPLYIAVSFPLKKKMKKNVIFGGCKEICAWTSFRWCIQIWLIHNLITFLVSRVSDLLYNLSQCQVQLPLSQMPFLNFLGKVIEIYRLGWL